MAKTQTPAGMRTEQELPASAPRMGYSMSELRYQRALTALQIEFCKSRMRHEIDDLKKTRVLPFSSDGKASWVGKIMSGLHYTDYALLGFSAFSSLRKVLSFFSGRRKSKNS